MSIIVGVRSSPNRHGPARPGIGLAGAAIIDLKYSSTELA